MSIVRLGEFQLEFDARGKLVQLSAGALGPLLHRTPYRIPLEGGGEFEPGGWDECFPTIEPFEGSPTMGDLVPICPDCRAGTHSCVQRWTTSRFHAERRFRGVSPRHLEVAFAASNRDARPARFLWASHAIFSLENLCCLVVEGGLSLGEFGVNGTSSKTFHRNGGEIRLTYGGGEISLGTDQPWWGIWLNRGGWPVSKPAGLACVGIEATNCDADSPRAATLPPGGQFEGHLHLKIADLP